MKTKTKPPTIPIFRMSPPRVTQKKPNVVVKPANLRPSLPFALSGILVNGQSLSVGTWGMPVVSTTQSLGNVQLHDSSGNYTDPESGTWSLVPLIAPERADKFLDSEASNPYPTNINGESPDITLANALALLCGGRMLTSNAGKGSASYTLIFKGGSANSYQSLLNEATVATGMGVGYGVAFATLTHGETDYGVPFYDSVILAYQAELEADTKAITGQPEPIPLIYNQMNSWPPPGSNDNYGASMGQIHAAQRGISVIKTSATVGGTFDAGATSVASLAGDGYVQTKIYAAQDATVSRLIGLAHTYAGLNYDEVDFGINFAGSVVQIWEGGVFKGEHALANDGDVFRISIAANVVTYLQNGNVIYTSANVPTFPLHVQTGTYSQYTGLYNLELSSGPLNEWSNIVGSAITDSSKMLFSGPNYYLPFYTDKTHLTAAGYRLLGEQYARAAYKHLSSGWKPLLPTAIALVGNVATVTFDVPVEPLVFDGVQTSPHLSGALSVWANGKGFEARDGAGTPITITSVAIVAPNQVAITCASAPNTIAYACTQDSVDGSKGSGGFPDGRCGLLHDSDPFVGPITGTAQPNWAPSFSYTNLSPDVPTSLSGCVLWLRADRGTTIGTGVHIWADQSGTGDANKNVSQASGPNQPTLNASDPAYNNQATLSFNSAALQAFQSGVWAAPLAEPETIYIVGNSDGAATTEAYSDGGSGNEKLVVNDNGGGMLAAYAGAFLNSGVALSAAKAAFAVQFDGATSKVWVSDLTPNASGNTGGSTRTGLAVGSSFGGGNCLNGKIAEVIIFNRILSALEHAQVMNYLGARYGITIGA